GRPASYGCVRMKSRDVIRLYDIVGPGARVSIINAPLAAEVPALAATAVAKAQPENVPTGSLGASSR
ncbi:MAG: L,D-transpeptidase family protein, partial [Chthoniobacterales bacterium]